MAATSSELQATAEAQPALEPRATSAQLGVRFAVVAFLIALDLWSKSAVFEWLQSRPPPDGMTYDVHGHHRYPVLGDWFGFMLSWNPGMAWGFDKLPTWLLVVGRCGAVAFLAWLVARAPRGWSAMPTALVLILSGAAGNLYDNLFMEPRRAGARFGEVRDFLDVHFTGFDWHFPTFNVADACITVGAVFLIGASFLGPSRGKDPKAT